MQATGTLDYDRKSRPTKPQEGLGGRIRLDLGRNYPEEDLAHLGFEPASGLAHEQRFGLGVPENRLGLGIPGDLSVQSCCDPGEVASREGSMVAMHIRDRLDTIPSGFEEVSEVVDQRSVFVSGFESTAWQWVVFKVVDSLASNSSAVNKQPPLGAFE
jgi:hypothetical protein